MCMMDAESILSKDEVIENLKTMIFGKQAFERFTAEERNTLDTAISLLEKIEENNYERNN